MFLADSEIDSSTSTLPGPRQFAVPSRFDIARRRQEKLRDEPGFGIVETVEKRISIGPEGKRKKKKKHRHPKFGPGFEKDTKSSSSEDETSSSESDSDGDIPEELGIKLISTPPGMESEKEMAQFGVVQPRSIEERSPEPSTSIRRPRPLFESISDDNLQNPTAVVELSQSQPVLTVSREGYEEVSSVFQTLSSYTRIRYFSFTL